MVSRVSRYFLHVTLGIAVAASCIGIAWLVGERASLKSELAAKTNQLEIAKTENSCTSRDLWKAGTTKEFTLTSGGTERAYRVHLPKDYSADQSYPVILVFNGKGGDVKKLEASVGLTSLPAISVYPYPLAGKDGPVAWEGAPYSPDTSDVAFMSDVLDKLEGQLCVQKTRIYSVGMSNGGGMSWLLSCKMSDRIAAFATIAGAYYYPENKCQPERPVAVLSIHGDQDAYVPYYGSEGRKLPSVATWLEKRAKSNKCNQKPTITQPDGATEITTWNNCAHNATVQSIRLIGGGHAWPISMGATLPNKKVATAKTSAILWNFFVAHPR